MIPQKDFNDSWVDDDLKNYSADEEGFDSWTADKEGFDLWCEDKKISFLGISIDKNDLFKAWLEVRKAEDKNEG